MRTVASRNCLASIGAAAGQERGDQNHGKAAEAQCGKGGINGEAGVADEDSIGKLATRGRNGSAGVSPGEASADDSANGRVSPPTIASTAALSSQCRQRSSPRRREQQGHHEGTDDQQSEEVRGDGGRPPTTIPTQQRRCEVGLDPSASATSIAEQLIASVAKKRKADRWRFGRPLKQRWAKGKTRDPMSPPP